MDCCCTIRTNNELSATCEALATKSKHPQDTERVLKGGKVPAKTMEVGYKPLRQDVRLRAGKQAEKLVSAGAHRIWTWRY